jgi:hypothetical protein
VIRRAGASLRAGILTVGFLPLLWAAATEGDRGARSTGAGPTAAGAATPDFSTEILPLLTRIGCNNGQCHGASGGKAGFALSLRGYDPDSDFDALVRERSGRRIDVADPDKSLILRKPSLQIPHKGGRKLPREGEAYDTVRRWIDAGAPRHAGGPRTVVALEVEPKEIFAAPDTKKELHVRARMSDGSALEVNTLALFSSNDEGIASVDPVGHITTLQSGETAILIKYRNDIASVRVVVPYGPALPASGKAPATEIDRLVESQCCALGIPLSPQADDTTFLRRATLDLAGRIPTIEEVHEFAADKSPQKRKTLLERLAKSEGAAALWARWFADLTRVREESMTKEGAAILHHYLYATLKYHRPVDRAVRKLLTSTGSPYDETSGAGFMLSAAGPKELMEHVTRSFLGIRLQCAQCHQHPFDRWSRDDYYGAASFFSRVLVRPEDHFVVLDSFGELTDPRSGGDARCKLPGGTVIETAQLPDRRAPFANWLLDPTAMRFHRAMANRAWKQLFGQGLVEPVDDLRDANPPSHPELLDALALMLRDNNCDWLRFVSLIMESDAYARSTAILPGNERDRRHASHASPRPLPAAVALDAIADACGIKLSFPGDSEVTRAVNVRDEDGGSYTLRVLGTCPRDGTRDPGSPPVPTIPAALHLLHGPAADEWLTAPGGRVASILQRKRSPEQAVNELFMATLGRPPRADELASAKEALGDAPDAKRLGDLLWALMATNEFAFNH